MSRLALYECDVKISVAGVNYEFIHVASVAIEDPEENNLTRGANAKNAVGLAFRSGMREPKTMTMIVQGMEKAMFDLLKSVYKNTTRCDVSVVSRVDGSSKVAKNAVLGQIPQQKTLDDSPESMDVELMFRSFDIPDNHKT